MKESTSDSDLLRRTEALTRFSGRIIPGKSNVVVTRSDDVKGELIRQTEEHDLVIMGLGKPGSDGKVFGNIPLKMAEETDTALIFISHN